MCYGLGCEYENRLSGDCTWHGPRYYPCRDWGEDDEPEQQKDTIEECQEQC